MERLNTDELFKIAILLDLPDLLALCNSSDRINKLVCRNKNVWLYKLSRDFPNYKKFLSENVNYKDLYIDMKNYSLPTEYDKSKEYNILKLYKAVEKGYNTKSEFENFVKNLGFYNLFVNENQSLEDYLGYVEDRLGSYEPLNSGEIVIYFSYPEKKVNFGRAYEYHRPENLGLWSK